MKGLRVFVSEQGKSKGDSSADALSESTRKVNKKNPAEAGFR